MLTYPDPPLSDAVVGLRAWTDDDLDCVREAASDARIPAGTTVPEVFSVVDGLAFIGRQHARLRDGEGVSQVVVDESTARACGLVYLAVRPQPGVVGLGYWLVPSARGRGLGTRAARLASSWALSPDGLGAARVEAWVEPANVASQRLLVSAGFEREGVLRSFLALAGGRSDAVVFSRVGSVPVSRSPE